MPGIIAISVAAGLVLLLFLGAFLYWAHFLPLWVHAQAAGVHCPITRMIGMKFRQLDPKYIIELMIILRKAGVAADFEEFESHLLAGGDLEAVVEAMVSASKAGLDVTFRQICAIDLTGRDVLRAVTSCVNPIVIAVPSRGQKKFITAVAKDGIQLGVNVRVTVRADIHKLVGGAGEETVIARVGEGIVATVGRANDHREILAAPEKLSEMVLAKGLGARTAFEIVSVDVGDIDVLQNIGAQLQQTQADADQKIAQAKAEGRRALAVAATAEHKATVREMTALETANKAEIPKDMAGAYRRGGIWRSPRPVYGVNRRKLWDVLDFGF